MLANYSQNAQNLPNILAVYRPQMCACHKRRAVLEALATELEWGVEHATAHYALLNACRALSYLYEKRLVAKTTGGKWALDHGVGPADGIHRAMAAQSGGHPVAELSDVEVDFIERAVLLLSAAAEDG